MLRAAVLLEELQRFGDPGAPVFAGWPTGKADARRKWAHAFQVYLSDMVDTVPTLIPTGGTLAFTGVEDAFFASITLDNPFVPDAAADLADAWRAGITALRPGSSATHGGDTFMFEAMAPTDVAARHAALNADLVAAFTSPQVSRRADLTEIADALHRATVGLKSTPSTFVVTYG
ncbi:hypothetical protein [Sorangium sp. So ce394]|uniref:hypothetical protein n=1 Tax=Sorangium sp. So ce394 TaxID=3133310 RepID=UPI003F5BF1F5